MPIFIKSYLKLFTISLVFQSLFRLLFYAFNASLFSSLTGSEISRCFYLGLRFDLHSITIILILPLLLLTIIPSLRFKKLNQFVLIACFGMSFVFFLASLICNLSDIAYYPFIGRRLSYDLLRNTTDMSNQLTQLLVQYWYLLGLAMILSLAYYKSTKHIFFNDIHFHSFTQRLVTLCCLLPLAVLFMRGGLQRKPLSLTHAFISQNNHLNALTLNSLFSLLRSKDMMTIQAVQHFQSTDTVLTMLNKHPEKTHEKKLKTPQLSKSNVLVIILESFSTSYMSYGHHNIKSYTPFLDELAAKSLYYQYHYSNGRTSMDAPMAIFASLPNLMDQSFLSSNYQTLTLKTLPHELGKRGYKTTFFHGGKNGTMFFDVAAKRLGFQKYLGLKEYPNKDHYDGTWGIFDDHYLQYCLKMLSKQDSQPFLASIFTLSSHNPYTIPKKYQGQFTKGSLPIHESIQYVDHALRLFFQEAQKTTWFKNTLFVITGDHSEQIDEASFKNEQDTYRVPLLFFHGGGKLTPMINKKVAQHIDIAPTILDLLAIKDTHMHHLAHSLLSSHPGSVINQQGQNWWLIYDHILTKKDPHHQTYHQPLLDQQPLNHHDYPILKNKILAMQQYFNDSLLQGYFY